jgi:hypothetical protein
MSLIILPSIGENLNPCPEQQEHAKTFYFGDVQSIMKSSVFVAV